MNPDVQRYYGQLRLSDCILRTAPTLRQIDALYGPHSAQIWIVPQLTRIAEFCGQTARWSTLQMQELTAIILQQFGGLTVCELAWFFQQFKGGRYERFYGTPDPMVLTRSLRAFLSDRNQAWQRIEQEREAERRRRLPEACTGIAALNRYLARLRQHPHEPTRLESLFGDRVGEPAAGEDKSEQADNSEQPNNSDNSGNSGR